MSKQEPFMSKDDLYDFIADYYSVRDILGDADKACTWFTTANPHLGRSIPINMYLSDRGHKVRKFIMSIENKGTEFEDIV